MKRRLSLLALTIFAALAVYARVGGGESYSGGGSSSGDGGSGGGSGGGEILYYIFRFLLWLTIEHPLIGIPVDIVVIFLIIRWFRTRSAPSVVTIGSAVQSPLAPARLDSLRRFDPNFSEITFSDFCYSLYGFAHYARRRGEVDRYAPYLSDNARAALRSRGPQGLTEVRGVVVGAFEVVSIGGLETQQVLITVSYESNYTEVAGGAETSWYVKEQWTLERHRDILSPPPEKSKADHCPRCGAALQTRTDGSCEYCGVRIRSGAFNWYVRSISLRSREPRGPLLTSNVPERGTDRPTVYQPGFGERRAAFEAAHPELRWDAFERHVRTTAIELQAAWTARQWERVRPLETESLFQMHRYWIDAYLRQKLQNIVADHQILRVDVVKIDTDAFYESITVRIWAQGRDYTVDAQGKVVSGSERELRTWSEYWTFVRTRNTESASGQAACPNCGALVPVGATGICPYCGGKLTAGEFDWVLSKIEQDDSYRG
jgi:RNA polymerase subunit RPABC4/transcription elongation factor Spt4